MLSTSDLQSSPSFSLAAHSRYGTDDRVKLPNLTDEEVHWQGLEDLYSINESLYECRPEYSPSPENWANFQKDVDNMFALRHVFNKLNRTHKLDDSTLPELGSGAGGGVLEEGSGEELASASDIWPVLATEACLTTPAPSNTPSPKPTPMPTLERKLESAVNSLPEKLVEGTGVSVMSASPASSSGPRRDRVVFQSDMWAQQLEEMEGDMFSGNGLTELETGDNLLLTLNSLHVQLEPGPEHTKGLGLGLDPEEEDIFQAQGYLPLSPQTLRSKVQASTTGSPPTTQASTPQNVRVLLQTLPQSALPLTLDNEGSGSLPQPSNQTL